MPVAHAPLSFVDAGAFDWAGPRRNVVYRRYSHLVLITGNFAVAINILDMLKSQLGGQIAGQLGRQFGESEQATKSGIEALVPTILGGLLKQVSAPGGADKLDSALKDGGYDGGLLDNLSGMLSGGGADSLTSKGGGLISMLVGDKSAMIAPILAKLTGMKVSSITSLLAILAPLVMSFLGKQKKTMGLDSSGLANLLMSQKDSIGAALPAGISDAMGLGSLGIAGPAVSRAAASKAPVPAAGGGGVLKYLIPLAILGAVGYGCYRYIFDGIRPRGAAGNTVVEVDPNAVLDPSQDGGGAMSGGAMSGERPAEEAPAEEAAAPAAESMADKLGGALGGLGLPGADGMPDVKSMFESMTGALGKVTDEETAKAALPDLEAVDKKLESISSDFGLLPEAARSKLTDSLNDMVPDFQATIDKVMAIPGVKDILQPIIDKVMAKVKSLTL